jgi:hypothetical protein
MKKLGFLTLILILNANTIFAFTHATYTVAAGLPNGTIYRAGRTQVNGSQHIIVSKFRANGELDPSFGVNGSVVTIIGNNSAASGITIGPDLKVIVDATSDGAPIQVRYNHNGTLDMTFGENGINAEMMMQ